MVLPRRISSSFSVLFFISFLCLSDLAFAELTLDECKSIISATASALYEYLQVYSNTPPPMKWCPLWAVVCTEVYYYCPGAVTCQFTNDDPNIKEPFDPSNSLFNPADFLTCTSCNVKVNPPSLLSLQGVDIPGARNSPTTGDALSGVFPSDESPNDILADIHADNPSASSVTSAVTTAFVLCSILGSLIAVKSTSANAASLAGATGAGASGPATISNPKTGSGSSQSVIDAVTLLLHFQSISTSGLLSISYPALYRFFTYNFSWANLIIASDMLVFDVQKMGFNPSCLGKLGSLNPSSSSDQYAVSGIAVLGQRYGLDRTTIGGLVYLSTIIGVVAALGVFGLVALVLHTLNEIFRSNKLQVQLQLWPSKASSMSLRLFMWAFGSVATFAIYQFAEPCSSTALIAFGAIEFIMIILTLLIVSIFIIKIAKAQGPEALFPLSDSEPSKYSRKWGSLYSKFKPTVYWFFIPDYIWVFAKSLIVGIGQSNGFAQVCALLGIEWATLLALLIKRPYATSSGNAFHIFSACKRVLTSASLLVFWDGYTLVVPTAIKRIVGIILICIESAYAVGLFVALLLNGGKAIVKWNADRKEQKRALVTEPKGPLEPHLHYDSSGSNLEQDKF